MLNLREYYDQMDEIEPGQTTRFNHTECTAGEDTRRRLYVTRTLADPTTCIAYCHNCQEGGRYDDNGYAKYRTRKHFQGASLVKNAVEDNVTEPPGLIHVGVQWPIEAKSWAYANKVGTIVAKYGVAYDPSSDRVYLPRYRYMRGRERHGELVGYQLRNLHKNSQPKYVTVQKKDAVGYMRMYPNGHSFGEADSGCAVIVEDFVSGIAIIEATKLDACGIKPTVYVNYGTKVDATMMYKIAGDYDSVLVWLDNDSEHVIEQANTMVNTILLYSDSCEASRVITSSDPKHYSGAEIRAILQEGWRHG